MCIFSYIFLGETLKGYYKIVIVLAFVGCSVIIDGNYIKDEGSGNSKPPAPVSAWLAVGAQALQSSISTIVMRKMKSVHWVTLNIYFYTASITIAAGSLGLKNISLVEQAQNLDWIAWTLIVIVSWTEVSNKSFRLMSFRYQDPGKLAPYVYLYSFWSLAYSIFIFHNNFNAVTWSGIVIVALAFVYHTYKMV